MATELQALLDRIQNEGVAKADAEAGRILDEAHRKATAIVAEAQARAATATRQAETESALFRQRAEQAVRQAARDVVLGVSEAVDQTLQRLLLAKTSAALSPDFLRGLLADTIRAYAATPDGRQGIEALVAPEQAEALRNDLLQNVRAEAGRGEGVRIRADRDVAAGFRVSLAEGRIEHDFTAQAIQAAMSRLLRPALAKLLAAD